MVKTMDGAVKERIEIVDQPDEIIGGEGGLPLRLILPVALVAVGALVFFVVRRFRKDD